MPDECVGKQEAYFSCYFFSLKIILDDFLKIIGKMNENFENILLEIFKKDTFMSTDLHENFTVCTRVC